MKHPFWIVNSTLLLLLLFVLAFIYFSRVPIPDRKEISVPRHQARATRSKDTKVVSIEALYENDLFDTYRPAGVADEFPVVAQIPDPPRDIPVSIPRAPEAHFLEPLDISLKGIIVMRQDTTKNTAIIEDNKTKQEGTYRVGDSWEDAQLISIFNNKIVFLRSNGQQEVLYLREQDAKLDPSYLAVDGWNEVIRSTGINQFDLDPAEFTKRVKNLAQFIDLFGLTSAYRKGTSIGCRIGALNAKSLGGQLGLHSGDIILSINDTPVGSTDGRLKAYEVVTNMKESDSVSVNLLRAGREFDISITLRRLTPDENPGRVEAVEETARTRETTEVALNEQRRFAPTVDKMRQRSRKNMKQYGAAPNSTA